MKCEIYGTFPLCTADFQKTLLAAPAETRLSGMFWRLASRKNGL
jgi:hypothetical protein